MEQSKPTEANPVIVFGEAMLELSGIEGDACRLSVAGDTFNTAVYLQRAGVPVAYATAVGKDAFSARITDALLAEGIGARYVLRRSGGTPGLYAVSIDTAGERSFTYWRSASAVRDFFSTPGHKEVLRMCESAPLLYLSGITLSLFGQSDRAALTGFVRAVREKGGEVAFDTNYRPAGWGSRDEAAAAVMAIAPFVSLALPTFEDDRDLFGDPSPQACADRWAAAGAAEVVVKNGPEGALTQAGWVRPPERLMPRDTTGAGDSFNAGYLAARLRGEAEGEAAMAGHRLAARILMTPGAILPRDAA
ncbi:MAG: sugar kinase [Erythrobacter sp.]|nr:sugar kinase [Erythrobacter sp.]